MIGVLFAWSYFGNLTTVAARLEVPIAPGILAIATITVTLISYFTIPIQRLRDSTYLNYILITATAWFLVIQTGGQTSIYLPLLVVALGVAGLLKGGGVTIALVALTSYVGFLIFSTEATFSSLLPSIIISLVAIFAGLALWGREQGTRDAITKEDRSYSELASQLSQVSGKSDAVINAIGDGVLALDVRGVIQLINPAAEKLLGWTSHDALGLDYKSVLKIIDTRNSQVSENNDPVAQTLITNKPNKSDTYSLGTQSGKSFMANISVSPVGQAGQGAIVVFRDITDEKSDERQRAEFISTASHEMRTPVASIEGYLGIVLNPKIATIDAKARDYIMKAHDSAQHLGRLFADLLDVSKADDGRLKNDPRVVDVIPFIRTIVEGLLPKAVEKQLFVYFKPQPFEAENSSSTTSTAPRQLSQVIYARVDNDHLREVTQNLVENAIKYTPQGQIVVDVVADQRNITISIADSGIGIPREDQHHLFQKFYRVDSTDTREIGGTGLGLYLCRRLTETIGGRIWVESEHQKGSTFFVEIPRIDSDEAARYQEFEKQADAQKAAQIAESEAAAHAAAMQQAASVMPTATMTPQPTPTAPPVPVAPIAPPAPASPEPTAAPAAPSPAPVTPVIAPSQPVVATEPTAAPRATQPVVDNRQYLAPTPAPAPQIPQIPPQ